MRSEMKTKYLFALAMIAVFLAVPVVPVRALPTVTVIIKDPSHTHGAVIIGQNCQPIPPCGARSHVFELSAQTQLDADTWSVSIPLTADIFPFVPWTDTSLPITVGVYDLRDSHYNNYCCYFLHRDFTGTFVVCYDPDVSVGGLCPTAVGGLLIPANSFAVLSPWLAVIGLVGCIGTVVVVAKRRK
jgi:hypothetical protein